MYELECPSCSKPSHYNFVDFLLLCPFCSATFHFNSDSGQKDVFHDHYIVSNALDQGTVKELAIEWLRRIHHRPGGIEKEFFVTEVKGISLPLWIVSLEGHTAWKGLVKKQNRQLASYSTQDHLVESGQFRRSYRWAVSARTNICEIWGLSRLHQPTEPVIVEWDGFPFDSTFSRGRLVEEETKPAYESRNYFEFKYANGLPILGIQVDEDEGIRRAKHHVELYHYKLASLNSDYLIDYRTELEIAGVQLIHVPIWKVSYVYQPRSLVRYFIKPQEKKILMDGYGKGILTGEISLVYHDKVMINAYVTGLFAFLFFLLAVAWHPAFFLVSFFSLAISGFSIFTSLKQKAEKEEQELSLLSSSIGRSSSASSKPKIA